MDMLRTLNGYTQRPKPPYYPPSASSTSAHYEPSPIYQCAPPSYNNPCSYLVQQSPTQPPILVRLGPEQFTELKCHKPLTLTYLVSPKTVNHSTRTCKSSNERCAQNYKNHMEIPSSPRSSVQSNYDDAYYSEKDFAKRM